MIDNSRFVMSKFINKESLLEAKCKALKQEVLILNQRLSNSKRDNRTNRDRLRSENKKLRAKLVVLENALRGLVGYCAKG